MTVLERIKHCPRLAQRLKIAVTISKVKMLIQPY
jgi:hypothetical protein